MKGFLPSLALSALLAVQSFAGPSEFIRLWPGVPPGDENVHLDPEVDKTKPTDKLIAGRRIIKLGNVSTPDIAVYPVTSAHSTGTSVIICPGGGHHILAYDLEGTEVAEWLNSIGVTAFVLKYRVPFRDKDQRWISAVQDAQRAVSLIRGRADEFGIDPNRIGLLGFSAGGETAALASIFADKQRQYEPVDDVDRVTCRPDFTVMIYTGGIIDRETREIQDYVAKAIDKDAPPAFLVHAFDDRVPCEASTQYFIALRKAGVPAELHIYPEGGHGYGLRRTEMAVTTWPDRCEAWLKQSGWLEPWFIADFGDKLGNAYAKGKPLPQFSARFPEAGMGEAYAVQGRYLEHVLKTEKLAGFKGAAVSEGAHRKLGIDEALSAVLFESGWLSYREQPVLDLKAAHSPVVETELGVIIGKGIRQPIGSVEELLPYIQSVVPVIELPGGAREIESPSTAADMVTCNVTSANFIVGPESNALGVDLDSVKITLKRDGKVLHETTGGEAAGGQWANILHQVNHALRQGYKVEQGQLIITGALGRIAKGEPGKHTATFGPLGKIEFTLK